MADNQKRTREQLIQEWIIEDRLDTNIAIPAKVLEFHETSQTVKVEVQIKRQLKDGKILSAVKLDEVPVQILNAGGFQITLPISPGDGCLLVFSQRDITNWQKGDGEMASEPASYRLNDISDAIAIVGINPESKAVENYNTEDLEIRNADQSSTIRLKADGTIEMTSQSFSINGEVEVNGKLTVNDDIDCTGTVTASTDVVGGGVSLVNHQHTAGTYIANLSNGTVSGLSGNPQ
jgi:hypothetical protein